MREHDSMVFTPDGQWFWNSRRLHGSAIDFMIQYEGRSVVEAILTLAGEMPTRPHNKSPGNIPREEQNPQKVYVPPPKPPPEKQTPFQPPPKANTQKHLYGYLCKTRHLSSKVVKEMIDQGILYQSEYKTQDGKSIYNACFLSFNDLNGTPCNAYCRGLTSYGKPFKRESVGGDKSSGWIFRGKDTTDLYVFEAAIDAASYVELSYRQGKEPLQGADYLALGGLQFTPIQKYLDGHSNVKSIHLMLDNDLAGRTAARQFFEKLQQTGYLVKDHIPPEGKDWNEYLQNLPEKMQIRAPPKQESMAEIVASAKARAAAAERSTCTHANQIER